MGSAGAKGETGSRGELVSKYRLLHVKSLISFLFTSF